jgi:cell division protein FtsN
MKVRQYPVKSLILVFFFLLFVVSVILTSADFRNFVYRLAHLDRKTERSSKKAPSGPQGITRRIVNRQSIRIDPREEAQSKVPAMNVSKEGEQGEYSDDTARPIAPAKVNIKTQASVARAEKQDSSESEQRPTKPFYSLHVGSFKKSASAVKWAAQLTAMGHVAWSERVTLPRKGDWYRVYLGKYIDNGEAAQLGKKLKDAGIINYFAIHKKNE